MPSQKSTGDALAAASSPREQKRRQARKERKRSASGDAASQQPLDLQIREFPDTCVFLNKEYTVQVFAMNAKKILHPHPQALELVMFYANGVEVPPGEIAKVSPFSFSDSTHICAEVKLTFFKPSLQFKNEKVYFIVRPEGSASSGDSGGVASSTVETGSGSPGTGPLLKPVTSPSVLVVRRRLVVLTKLPEKWYKDQGGREKHMCVTVEMRDGDNQPVCPNSPVPLEVRVGYEHSDELADNRILLLMGENAQQPPEIGTDGRATIRFRIQEVSSGHRRQRFCLVVGPDIEKSPLNADIASARSSAVDVRSKVPNKAKRKAAAANAESGNSSLSPLESPGSSRTEPEFGLSPHQSRQRAGSADRAGHGGDMKRMRMQPGQPREKPTLTGNGMGATMKAALDSFPTGSARMFSSSSRNRTAEESWVLATIDILRKMEWQMIGYGVDATGDMNYAEKIYRCPSCYRCSEPHTDDCPLHIAIVQYDRLFRTSDRSGGGGSSPHVSFASPHHVTSRTVPARQPSLPLVMDGNAGMAALSRLPSFPNNWAPVIAANQLLFSSNASSDGGKSTSRKGADAGATGGARETWMPTQPDNGFRTLDGAKNSGSISRNHSLGATSDDFAASSSAGGAAPRVVRNTSITAFEMQNSAPVTVNLAPRSHGRLHRGGSGKSRGHRNNSRDNSDLESVSEDVDDSLDISSDGTVMSRAVSISNLANLCNS
eukprot:INCI955.1.p1 GENE.INCI955.1~~INCI955.1.p1  ORF type:complete len:716 (+),score=111.80 INCI955.1:276-2423(+)